MGEPAQNDKGPRWAPFRHLGRIRHTSEIPCQAGTVALYLKYPMTYPTERTAPMADPLTQQRIEDAWLSAATADYSPDPDDIAAELVDQDVAAGEYEGCSTDLELAFGEYQRQAIEVIG